MYALTLLLSKLHTSHVWVSLKIRFLIQVWGGPGFRLSNKIPGEADGCCRLTSHPMRRKALSHGLECNVHYQVEK